MKAIVSNNLKRIHLKIKDEKCQLCDFSAPTMSEVRKHTKTVHLKMEEYSCEKCDYKSAYSGNIDQHKRAKHAGKDQEKIKCMECNNTFNLRQYLVAHVKRVHNKIRHGIKDIECNICDRAFSDGKSLTRHIQNVHDTTIQL